MKALFERYIADGRSTPGEPQPNEVPIDPQRYAFWIASRKLLKAASKSVQIRVDTMHATFHRDAGRVNRPVATFGLGAVQGHVGPRAPGPRAFLRSIGNVVAMPMLIVT